MEKEAVLSKCKPNMAYAFDCYEDLSDVNDSMELESGQIIAELNRLYHRVELRVVGDVRVVYKDEVYKSVSQMPDELVQLFHWEKAWENEDVYIDDNNWFEVLIYKDSGLWTGYGEVVECEGMSPADIECLLNDCLYEYLEAEKREEE